MPGIRYQLPYICARCLRIQRTSVLPVRYRNSTRHLSQSLPLRSSDNRKLEDEQDDLSIKPGRVEPTSYGTSAATRSNGERKQGAMFRRLAEATEDALIEGGRAGRKAVEEAGFSEELKNSLLERVEAAKFRSDNNAAAFAEAGLGSNVGQGSRQIATGQIWTGEESSPDAMLRMLDGARKPLQPGLRGPVKIPDPSVDLRLKPKAKQRLGERLANARDRTSIYAVSKDSQMTDEEREQRRRGLKERFGPGVGTMPNSFRGLAALANERIEDAIARGQFKNIPRGKAIVRDVRADNPFIDTTEYIMNKMIQRQEIVPPWIEKQQELVKATNLFRARLRNDWKRHAARTIASRGGSLQEQMRIADRYAEAEKAYNPKKRAVEQISLPDRATNDPAPVKIVQEAPATPVSAIPPVQVSQETQDGAVTSEATSQEQPQTQPESPAAPLPALFRIPTWEAAENSYLTLAVQNLNSLARSYNLMAPEIAKKPYFSLERELKACYADVAPQLSQAIKDRSARPAKTMVEIIGHKPGGVLERFASDKVVIYDSKRPKYGFKELWSDLWRPKSA